MRTPTRLATTVSAGPGRVRHTLLVLGAVVAATSCGRSDRVPTYPVKGTVRCQGKAATGALVVFHPLDASETLQRLRPAGTVNTNGTFVLSTYEPEDGAPAGQFRVTVVCASAGDGGRPGPDRFKGRYANPNDSPLRATVAAGNNQIEAFDLQH